MGPDLSCLRLCDQGGVERGRPLILELFKSELGDDESGLGENNGSGATKGSHSEGGAQFEVPIGTILALLL